MDEPVDILNWRRHGPRLTSSGQPSEEGLARIARLGVERIVNLGPHGNDGALADEPGAVAALGMAYTYIPVDFEAPTEADLAAFADALAASDAPTHVHCIFNARVSAFLYRAALGTPAEEEARANMEGIWRPGGVWARFVGRPEEEGLPSRYAGYDY